MDVCRLANSQLAAAAAPPQGAGACGAGQGSGAWGARVGGAAAAVRPDTECVMAGAGVGTGGAGTRAPRSRRSSMGLPGLGLGPLLAAGECGAGAGGCGGDGGGGAGLSIYEDTVCVGLGALAAPCVPGGVLLPRPEEPLQQQQQQQQAGGLRGPMGISVCEDTEFLGPRACSGSGGSGRPGLSHSAAPAPMPLAALGKGAQMLGTAALHQPAGAGNKENWAA